MLPLSAIRDGWDKIEEIETQLLREMTVEESLHWVDALAREFEPALQETDAMFRPEREAAMIELQRRCSLFAEWYRTNRA